MIAPLTCQQPGLQGWGNHPSESKCTIYPRDDTIQSRFSLPKGGAPRALQSSGLYSVLPNRHTIPRPLRFPDADEVTTAGTAQRSRCRRERGRSNHLVGSQQDRTEFAACLALATLPLALLCCQAGVRRTGLTLTAEARMLPTLVSRVDTVFQHCCL